MDSQPRRPDLSAAERGGDPTQPMETEGDPASASLEQARYWRAVYLEVLEMEEKVLARITDLMPALSAEGRREVELTNVPVITAHVQRFRDRLAYWTLRVAELE